MKLSPTVTNSDMFSNLMRRLGDRKSAELRSSVVFELNNRINALEMGPTLPWFLEGEYSFTAALGVRKYDLPSDFLREPEDGRLLISQDAVTLGEATKVDYDELTLTPGQPTQYALYGEQLVLATPDGEYDCTLDYFAASEEVEDNTLYVTNPWLINAYDLTTLHCLRVIAQFHIQDPDMAIRFDMEMKEAADRFWRLVEARKHAGRSYKIED